jgi:hypothetical protein
MIDDPHAITFRPQDFSSMATSQYVVCGLILPISSLGSPVTDCTTAINKCSDITSIFAIASSIKNAAKVYLRTLRGLRHGAA